MAAHVQQALPLNSILCKIPPNACRHTLNRSPVSVCLGKFCSLLSIDYTHDLDSHWLHPTSDPSIHLQKNGKKHLRRLASCWEPWYPEGTQDYSTDCHMQALRAIKLCYLVKYGILMGKGSSPQEHVSTMQGKRMCFQWTCTCMLTWGGLPMLMQLRPALHIEEACC